MNRYKTESVFVLEHADSCRHSEAWCQRCFPHRCIPGVFTYDQPNAGIILVIFVFIFVFIFSLPLSPCTDAYLYTVTVEMIATIGVTQMTQLLGNQANLFVLSISAYGAAYGVHRLLHYWGWEDFGLVHLRVNSTYSSRNVGPMMQVSSCFIPIAIIGNCMLTVTGNCMITMITEPMKISVHFDYGY